MGNWRYADSHSSLTVSHEYARHVSWAAAANRAASPGFLEQAKDLPGDGMVIPNPRQQAVPLVSQDCGHAAGVGRDDRQTGRERLEHGARHVVDVRRLDVDVRRVIPAWNLVMWHRAHERDTGKSKVARQPAERRLLGFRARRRSAWRRDTGPPRSGTLEACTRGCTGARGFASTASEAADSCGGGT